MEYYLLESFQRPPYATTGISYGSLLSEPTSSRLTLNWPIIGAVATNECGYRCWNVLCSAKTG